MTLSKRLPIRYIEAIVSMIGMLVSYPEISKGLLGNCIEGIILLDNKDTLNENFTIVCLLLKYKLTTAVEKRRGPILLAKCFNILEMKSSYIAPSDNTELANIIHYSEMAFREMITMLNSDPTTVSYMPGLSFLMTLQKVCPHKKILLGLISLLVEETIHKCKTTVLALVETIWPTMRELIYVDNENNDDRLLVAKLGKQIPTSSYWRCIFMTDINDYNQHTLLNTGDGLYNQCRCSKHCCNVACTITDPKCKLYRCTCIDKLKHKCRTRYCSIDCQAAGWNNHKTMLDELEY